MVTIIAATRWPGLHGTLIEAAAAAQIDFWGKAGVVGAQFNMYAGMGKGYWSKHVRCLTVQLGRRDKGDRLLWRERRNVRGASQKMILRNVVPSERVPGWLHGDFSFLRSFFLLLAFGY